MCTVSVVPSPDRRAVRLVMNRDERRLRPHAWPPQFSEVDELRVVWPIDPAGSGTWVAANEAGLVFALINLYPTSAAELGEPREHGEPGRTPRTPRTPSTRSRARVIPSLAGSADLGDVEERWRQLDLERFEPFRLMVADGRRAALMAWRGECRAMGFVDLDGPLMLTSSSLGDGLVEGARYDLFRSCMDSQPEPWRAQDGFHNHAWPDRRDVSVLMSRVEACTVSRTVLLLSDTYAELAYCPLVDGWPGPVSRAVLPIRAARRARAGRRAAVA